MNDRANQAVAMMENNVDDIKVLGFMFLQLLMSDFLVSSNRPSATLATILMLEQQGKLCLDKKLVDLFTELQATGAPLLTDGFGGSILRL